MLPKFMEDLQAIATKPDLSSSEEFMLEELKLWLENVLPEGEN
jgi:hypothetical protein